MKVDFLSNEKTLTVLVEGRLDTTTSPEFEKQVLPALDGVETLILDAAKLQYISSAGLREILMLQKTMSKQGKLVVKNVNDAVMEVFKMTGFTDILNIE